LINTFKITRGNLKKYTANCSERPIGEYMCEKIYTVSSQKFNYTVNTFQVVINEKRLMTR